MKLLLPLLALAGLSAAASLSQQECSDHANEIQDGLRTVYPYLEAAVNSDEAQRPENRAFADSLSSAMTQVSSATGPRSDAFHSEMVQHCGEGSEDVEDDMPFASAVFGALGDVYNAMPGGASRERESRRLTRRQSDGGSGLLRILAEIILRLFGIVDTYADILDLDAGILAIVGGILNINGPE
ncbi:uncharacterized protein DSM5745_04459 [Aspergillus mulundensis]|uniref:Uncharacterized protein n=1 Tax=Aspergillus mulundensis TaxID=1810919 RepID=A0A3D8SCV7_9EURO|nr:hypothetical protein DSM5745_04459 [Aspergillus mulundensis]RDW84133.1 hypothetical protein DSM5745_04459 [Aspergillus mulundensis]